MPIGGRDGDVAARMPEFRKRAEEAGRDPDSLEVSVFGGAPQPAELERCREAGIARVIFFLPPEARDTILSRLDRLASSMRAAS